MPLIRSTLLALLALSLTSPAIASGDEAQARELINAFGCKGCHSLGDNGGNLGPDLSRVGLRLDEKAIRSQLLDPRAGHPASMMPSYDHLPAADLETLVDYLKSRR